MVSTFATRSLAPFPVEQPGPVSTVLPPGQGELTCGPTTWEGTGVKKGINTSVYLLTSSHVGARAFPSGLCCTLAGPGSQASLMSLEQCLVSCEFIPLSAGVCLRPLEPFKNHLFWAPCQAPGSICQVGSGSRAGLGCRETGAGGGRAMLAPVSQLEGGGHSLMRLLVDKCAARGSTGICLA